MPLGNTFMLSFLGLPTTPLDFDASTVEVTSALESIPAIGAGNVSVTGSPGAWAVEFVGNRSAKNVQTLGISTSGLSRGLPISVTEEEQGALANEVQKLTLPAPLTGGTFTLSFKSLRVQETTKGSSTALRRFSRTACRHRPRAVLSD
jgi:hypothetical protein